MTWDCGIIVSYSHQDTPNIGFLLRLPAVSNVWTHFAIHLDVKVCPNFCHQFYTSRPVYSPWRIQVCLYNVFCGSIKWSKLEHGDYITLTLQTGGVEDTDKTSRILQKDTFELQYEVLNPRFFNLTRTRD